MANGVEVVWVVNRFAEVIAKVDLAVDLGLDTWAAEVEQAAAAIAPYETGGLRASRYRVSPITDEFATAVAAFLAQNPKGEPDTHPGAAKHGSVTVGFAAGYAAYVDQGHHTPSGSFVSANPFFSSTVQAKLPTLPIKLLESFTKVMGG